MKGEGLSNISINPYICAMCAYFKWAEPERPLSLFLSDTCLRISEALSLTEPKIDMQALLVRVKRKGQEFRQVPISLEARKVFVAARTCSTSERIITWPCPSSGNGKAMRKRWALLHSKRSTFYRDVIRLPGGVVALLLDE